MLKTLPFNAMRTLEAVVRLRGFGRAAEELNVSQSAVSQHVKQLEEWLGHPLLIRRSRETVPTEVGERLARATRDGFGGIQTLCEELRGNRRGLRPGILVASPPGFAFLWLLPRLLGFDTRHPEISVSLSTDPQSREPGSGDADVYISYSSGGFPGLHAERLMGEVMAPVCAPTLLPELASISDLGKHVLLRDTLDAEGGASLWDYWALETGLTLPVTQRHRTYGQANLVVQAAAQGLGIAMGRGPLVADMVAEGKLTYPFTQTAQSQFAYWLVCEHDALKSQPVQAFRAWLLETARSFETMPMMHATPVH